MIKPISIPSRSCLRPSRNRKKQFWAPAECDFAQPWKAQCSRNKKILGNALTHAWKTHFAILPENALRMQCSQSEKIKLLGICKTHQERAGSRTWELPSFPTRSTSQTRTAGTAASASCPEPPPSATVSPAPCAVATRAGCAGGCMEAGTVAVSIPSHLKNVFCAQPWKTQ